MVFLYHLLGYIVQGIGIMSIGLILLSVLGAWRRVKKPQQLLPKKMYTSAVTGALSFGLFYWLSGFSLNAGEVVLYGGIGLMVGYFFAGTIQVFIKETKVWSRGSILYLVVWGVVYAVTQVMRSIQMEGSKTSLLLSVLSFVMLVTLNGLLLRRYFSLDKEKAQS